MKKITFLFGALLLMLSCSDSETATDLSDEVRVTFPDLTTFVYRDSLLKTSVLYDRKSAPSYVSGVNIIADNSGHIVDSSFNFIDWIDVNNDGNHDGGGEPASMIVKTGLNTFKATGLAKNSAVNIALKDYFPTKYTGTLEEKAAAYSAQLLADYPLYTMYTGETTQDIFLENTSQSVDLSLIPVNGRVQVIFENEGEINYSIALKLYNSNGDDLGIKSQMNDIFNTTTASAIIFNTEESLQDYVVDVCIWIADDTNYITIPITIKAGIAITSVIKFVGDSGITESKSINKTILPVYSSNNVENK